MPTVSAGQTKLFVETLGRGLPTLCLHGGLAFDHTYLRASLDPLSDDLSLVYYDQRGAGRSRAELHGVQLADWAEQADALRAALGHERVLLFGHSFGGSIALHYALRYPERVAGLILCATSADGRFLTTATDRLPAHTTPEQLEALSTNSTDDAVVARCFELLMPLYFHAFEPTHAAAFAGTHYSAAAHAASFMALRDYDVHAALAQIKSKALVIAGRHDWLTPVDTTARPLANGLPNAQLIVFEDSGHLPQLEEQDKFQRIVRGFIRELDLQ